MVRTRIAPSPTGFPHVGTAYQALFDYVWAKKNKGRFLLRIEDTDVKRSVEGAEEVIYESLNWLGLTPDEGPKNPGQLGPYRQSERLALYQKYARQLVTQGDAYYCFCSPVRLAALRQEQEKAHQAPRYDGRCRPLTLDKAQERLAGGEKAVVRLKIPVGQTVVVEDVLHGAVNFSSDNLDDQILLKSDGFPTYHLALVVDDHLMGITHVFRGEEWLPSAPKHVLLYRMFGWTEPVWVHLPLLKNPGGGKISKREGHTSLFWYRDEGFLPEAVLNFLALLDWTPPGGQEVFSLDEMLAVFALKDLRKTAAVFDLPKLYWLNGVYLRRKSEAELYEALAEFAENSGNESLTGKLETQKEAIFRMLPLVRERMKTLKDFEETTDFFFKESVTVDGGEFRGLVSFPPRFWEELLQVLAALTVNQWTRASLETVTREVMERQQQRAKDVLLVLRLAVTGRKVSPPLWESLEILGKEKTLARLHRATSLLFS
jgi:glutamyl-tRNA synthetase